MKALKWCMFMVVLISDFPANGKSELLDYICHYPTSNVFLGVRVEDRMYTSMLHMKGNWFDRTLGKFIY